MKIFKFLSVGFLVVGMSLIIGCNKDKDLKNDQNSSARTFRFQLTFNAGDTVQAYSGITGFEKNDIIITYSIYEYINSKENWMQLPHIFKGSVLYTAEYSKETGKLYVYTLNADGTPGSPWTSEHTYGYKAVIIKNSALEKHPDLDFSNYHAVKEALDLED